MNKRIGNIEFLRFVFSLCIVLHHAMIPEMKMWGGYLSVEFFFILSGYFMEKHIYTTNLSDCSWQIILENDILYCKKRIVGIMPFFIIATVIGSIVLGGVYSWEFSYERVMSIVADFFFVQSLGLPVASVTGIVWYLSSMFIGLLLVYPLIAKKNRIFKICCTNYSYTMYGNTNI